MVLQLAEISTTAGVRSIENFAFSKELMTGFVLFSVKKGNVTIAPFLFYYAWCKKLKKTLIL